MDLSRPLTDRHEICTSLMWGEASEPACEFFYRHLKNFAGETQISSNFRPPAANRKCVASKRLNISTNKKPGVSFRINALKTVPNIWHHPTEFWRNQGRKLINYKMIRKNAYFVHSANFLLVGPYFQRIIFRPQRPLPIALIVWGWGLSKIFGDWKYFSAHCSGPHPCRPAFYP